MNIKATIRHNQSLFVCAAICLLIIGGLFACHLTEAQQKEIIETGAIVGTAVVTHTPIPWQTIGLLLGSILGSGAIVDNQRKDILIKVLQKANDANQAIITAATHANGNHPAKP